MLTFCSNVEFSFTQVLFTASVLKAPWSRDPRGLVSPALGPSGPALPQALLLLSQLLGCQLHPLSSMRRVTVHSVTDRHLHFCIDHSH